MEWESKFITLGHDLVQFMPIVLGVIHNHFLVKITFAIQAKNRSSQWNGIVLKGTTLGHYQLGEKFITLGMIGNVFTHVLCLQPLPDTSRSGWHSVNELLPCIFSRQTRKPMAVPESKPNLLAV